MLPELLPITALLNKEGLNIATLLVGGGYKLIY
jgi:hypothetical protein